MTDRLVLGTVQLGMPYGIANTTGKPDLECACAIVKAAIDVGVTRFDTAQAYGDSEEVLGRVFDRLKPGEKICVYSKLHPGLDLCREDVIRRSVEESLRKLGVNRLEGLLLHHEDGLRYWDKGLGRALRGLVGEGRVKSIGASFYTPQQALAALDIDGIDLIQVPANILDRRFEDAGVFRKARTLNKQVFVRSVFLQGLLLMPLERVPSFLKAAIPYLEHIEKTASVSGLTRQELALAYALRRYPDARVIFGAESRAQVMENMRALNSPVVMDVDHDIFRNVPENILNPACWQGMA